MPDFLQDKIYGQVVQVVSDITGMAPSDISGGTSLQNDLLMDSLSMFEIVIDLEEKFHTQISDEEVDTIKTVQDIVRFIKRKVYSVEEQT